MDLDSEPVIELDVAFIEASERVSQLARVAGSCDKALRGVRSAKADPVGARRALDAVGETLVACEKLLTFGEGLTALKVSVDDAVMTWRLATLGAIADAASASGLSHERLTATAFRLGPLTVEVDFDAGTATLSYARETLAVVRAGVNDVLDSAAAQVKTLERHSPSPEETIADLFQAYRVLTARQGLPFGERVFLVDLLPALFYVRQSEGCWKRQDQKSLRPVSRVQLAWELDHLHAARMLEHAEHRLVLGTATGGSASKKQQVLFLESAAAGGQFFLTLAFRRLTEG